MNSADTPITFESETEKEVLTSMMFANAVCPLFGALLSRRFPKWGYRYIIANTVLSAIAAVWYAQGEVDE